MPLPKKWMKDHGHEYQYWDYEGRFIAPDRLQNTLQNLNSMIIIAQPKSSFAVRYETWKRGISWSLGQWVRHTATVGGGNREATRPLLLKENDKSAEVVDEAEDL